MNGNGSQQGRASMWRRWAAAAATAALAVGFAVGAATPSDAASKAGTSVHLSAIRHVATSTNTGTAVVVAGDRVDLKGSTSGNLVGRTLQAQVKQGSEWSSTLGSGTVTSGRTFSIRIRVDSSFAGSRTFRVVYTGSSKLAASSSSRSVTVWAWLPLVQLPVSSTAGSSDVKAAASAHTNLTVKGRTYASLLAGDVPTGGTGAASFDLGRHCRTFRSIIGLTDSSPAKASIAYSVYFGDVAEIAPTVKHGQTKTIDLAMSKVSTLVLRNTEPDPFNAFDGPTVAAWPTARVLCNAHL